MKIADIPHFFQHLMPSFPEKSAQKDLSVFTNMLETINQQAQILKKSDDEHLRQKVQTLQSHTHNNHSPSHLCIDVFALIREVASRTIGLCPFEVQIMAGLAMCQGKVVEMHTGEGKTLSAVFPAIYHALAGKRVHILTFNDYLAQRDAAWMAPVYDFFNLTTVAVQSSMSITDRQQAYGADITYVTAREAGFDYLRSFLCYDRANLVHQPFQVAIVDEADSILIDEARVPLVIAGTDDQALVDPYEIAALGKQLEKARDFEYDEYKRHIQLTDEGIERVEADLKCGDLYAPENITLLTEIHLALQAAHLFQRDIDYIVRNGKIELVDSFTGRVADNRHWPDGLQAAVEAKEGVEVNPEGRILTSMTLQHFICQYPQICGMTATAFSAKDELQTLYGIDVIRIPPNRPCIRKDQPDLVFTHQKAKHQALLKEIDQIHATKRPVLVGTASVDESEQLSLLLHQIDIPHHVLNARTDDLEADIVSQAGALGAVTISTNMAGRGTDIKLGGKDEKDRDAVVALGGLYVIGTNRHESRRIDNQLRGRAGRQGDPGESRFFISLEDDLMVQYGIKDLISPHYWPPPRAEPIDHFIINREIARAQRIIEGQNLEIRTLLWEYAHMIELQRQYIHQWRQEVLWDLSTADLCAAEESEHYKVLCKLVGEDTVQQIEQRITLFHINRCWADYLAYFTYTRDGIHLVGLSGERPLDAFHKGCAEAFPKLLQRIEDEILATFKKVDARVHRIDLDKMGLQGPSSTWTYQLNDTTFTNRLRQMLTGNQNMAFAGGAVLMLGPVLLLWGLWQRFGKGRRGR